MNLEDTIVAISTPIGESGIGIVRMSGREAFPIAKKIFIPSSNNKISWSSSFKIYYGWIVDPDTKEKIDEVLLSLMKAPRTYTRQDIVEINCHGGATVLREVLNLCLRLGARLAEPGEFTKRAFLNGRIDLSQAESVLDIVQAKTEESLKLAVKTLNGSLAKCISSLRENMIDLLSSIEAEIDFSEEEIEITPREEKKRKLKVLLEKINALLEREKTAQLYREGIKVVIAGKTNVGKSSLLNALLERERAIVSYLPGTTRDTIEEVINIKGFPIKIVDTAGLKGAKNIIEEEGIKRTYHSLREADLVLFMIDGSSAIEKEDKHVFKTIEKLKKKTLLIINKIDLPQVVDKNKLKNIFPCSNLSNLIEISATKGTNLDKLKNEIANIILKQVNVTPGDFMINLRQKICLENAKKCIIRTIDGLNRGLSEEFLALELRESINHLDELTGKTLGEEVLNRIFSNFCIGK